MASLPASETDAVASAALATHEAKTTGVHGIPDTGELVTAEQLQEAIDGVEGGGGGAGIVWEDVALGANVTVFGAPYAPKIKVGQDGQIAHLSGLLTIGAGGIASGAVMFTLPVAARPAFKKVIAMIDANNAQSSSLMVAVIEPDGKVKSAGAFTAGQIPAFDHASYSLTN